MKYIITGGAGNVSKPLAEKLLSAGHEVGVIGRNADHLASLVNKGAKAIIGSVEDVDFLKKSFEGADAVYTMIPPKMDPEGSMKDHIASVGKKYADALRNCNIKYIVNLSSVGAHNPEGCGPVTGLHRAEKNLNELTGTNILHLRPGYFYTNLLGSIGMIKNMNIMGGNFGGKDFKMVFADPGDIASVAFDELNSLSFRGHGIRYIASDERTTDDIAKVIGESIGKPSLPWVVFSNEQALAGMIQSGIPEEPATNFAEMGAAMQSGILFNDYWKNRPSDMGKTKLEDFAKIFAAIYG
jgi:uncharacterized protein YbjT (DUF2867 family)